MPGKESGHMSWDWKVKLSDLGDVYEHRNSAPSNISVDSMYSHFKDKNTLPAKDSTAGKSLTEFRGASTLRAKYSSTEESYETYGNNNDGTLTVTVDVPTVNYGIASIPSSPSTAPEYDKITADGDGRDDLKVQLSFQRRLIWRILLYSAWGEVFWSITTKEKSTGKTVTYDAPTNTGSTFQLDSYMQVGYFGRAPNSAYSTIVSGYSHPDGGAVIDQMSPKGSVPADAFGAAYWFIKYGVWDDEYYDEVLSNADNVAIYQRQGEIWDEVVAAAKSTAISSFPHLSSDINMAFSESLLMTYTVTPTDWIKNVGFSKDNGSNYNFVQLKDYDPSSMSKKWSRLDGTTYTCKVYDQAVPSLANYPVKFDAKVSYNDGAKSGGWFYAG